MVAEQTVLQSFINGSFRVSESGESAPTVNPTIPSDQIALVPCGSPDVVDDAVESAASAQCAWARLPGPERAEHLYRWAEAIRASAAELTEATVREVGKPVGEAKGEVARCVSILRYYAGEAVRATGEVIPAQVSGSLQYSVRQPLGVVGLITPWNFPLAIPMWKAAPALAVGNTVVLKPAEASSYIGTLLARTALQAGVPAGVFNVVIGKGSRIGDALINNHLVNAISFTGSESVGLRIGAACAKRNIRFQTEMGGKNVGIVLADADLTQAANLIAGGAMRFAGQKCTATSRVVVDQKVKGRFLDALRSSVAALSVGDPAELATAVGPVISLESKEFLNRSIRDAAADCAYKGNLPDGLPSQGYFVAPTVFDEVAPDSDLAQEELFGPVLAITPAEGFEEAIELANNTRFGLSASLYTKDIPSALRYVDRIDAGMVRVNGDTTGVDPHAPFGGFKNSSSHTREQGPVAKEFYTELKTIQINP